MSSTSDRAATSRVRLRRPAIIEPPPPTSTAARRRALITWICGFDMLLVPLVILLPDCLRQLFPGAPQPLVLQTGSVILLLFLIAVTIFAWRAAMDQHRAALTEADGIGC